MNIKNYPKTYRIILFVSRVINVLTGGSWYQTFSARNHDWKREGKFNLVRLIDLLLGDGHCMMSWIEYYLKQHKQHREN